jgi:hypothetical protein
MYHLGLVQVVADVPSGLSLNPPQEIKNEKEHKTLIFHNSQ